MKREWQSNIDNLNANPNENANPIPNEGADASMHRSNRYDREWYFRSLHIADVLHDLLSLPVGLMNLFHIWSIHGIKLHLLDGLLLWRVKSIASLMFSKLFRWYLYQKTLSQLQSRFVAASSAQLTQLVLLC